MSRKPTKKEAESVRKGIAKFLREEFRVETAPTLSWYKPSRGTESAAITLPYHGIAEYVALRFNFRARGCRHHVLDSKTILVWAVVDGN